MEDLTLFRSVLTVGAVLVLAWWCSRFLGKQWAVKTSPASGHIRLLEQLQVGQDRRILLLKVGEEHYLVGVSQAGIQLLSKVEGAFDKADEPENAKLPANTGLPFSDFVRKHLEELRERMGGKP